MYSAIGLQINSKKTQIVIQESTPRSIVPNFTIDGHSCVTVLHLTNLSSTLSPSCNIDGDVQAHMSLASVAFGELSSRVF